jgi:ABC-type uncharacterized transport system substrate-binding protein
VLRDSGICTRYGAAAGRGGLAHRHGGQYRTGGNEVARRAGGARRHRWETIRLDFRLAEGDAGRFPELAVSLVRDNPAVIVANGPPAVRAAQSATHTIPIVATADDLVALGFIDSMAWPGGNITGVSLLITELDAKRLEVLKEILPAARRIGLLMETATRPPAVA